MRRLFLLLAMFVLAAGSLFAQGIGGGMTPGAGQGGTILVNTTKGLFALRNGTLAKYNATTLKQVQELSLFGAAPEAPADATDRAAMMKYYTDLQRRQAPAIMIAKDDSLLVVIGDGFARINQETLKPEATATLTAPGATTDAATPAAARITEPTPGYTLSGDTLFLMRGTELIAITVTDGKILSRVTLPKELQPVQMFGGRGGAGGGAGGAGGGRGGANGGGGRGGAGGGANGGGGRGGAGGDANGGGFAN